jgi:sporulation protein YlmC with PRC-barrel domain
MLASWKWTAMALGLGFVFCGGALADEPGKAQTGQQTPAQAEQQAPSQAEQPATAQAGQNAAAQAPMLDEDALIGMTVRDKLGREVGEVEDAVVGLPDGHIRYVVMSSDTLTRNGQMLALPWEAFAVKQNNGQPQFLQLRVDEKTALQAPKLGEDQIWPAALKEDFVARIDKQLGIQRAEVGYRGMPAEGANTSAKRLDKLEGADVQSSTAGDVGDVEDFLINAKTGRIEFVTIGSGGFLGLGESVHAVPMESLRLKAAGDQEEPVFQLTMTDEQFKLSPVVEDNATAATVRERVEHFKKTHLQQQQQPAQAQPTEEQPSQPRPEETQPQ